MSVVLLGWSFVSGLMGVVFCECGFTGVVFYECGFTGGGLL